MRERLWTASGSLVLLPAMLHATAREVERVVRCHCCCVRCARALEAAPPALDAKAAALQPHAAALQQSQMPC
jgi:hypothetical protein